MNVQIKVFESNFLAAVGLNKQVVGQDLAFDVIAKGRHSRIGLGVGSQGNLYSVGNFQAAFLAKVLNAVDNLARHTFFYKFVGEFHFESHGQIAFVRHQPTRNVFADNLYISRLYRHFVAFHHQVDVSIAFQVGDGLLFQSFHLGGDTFHQLTKLLTHCTEVALHFLNKHALSIFNEVQFLNVHFAHNEVFHCLDVRSLTLVYGRNHDLQQGLAHLDVYLTAQSQHH